MPYNISTTLIARLPQNQRDEPSVIGKLLFDRQAGKCALCDGAMTLAAEVLEADHDEPEGEGGETTLDNLGLAHQSCNRAKKSMSTAQVRPYLRFRRFIRDCGGRIRYDKAVEHWNIEPKSSEVIIYDDTVTINFPDKTSTISSTHTDQTGDGAVHYTFVEVPRCAIVNDDDVQPRPIRHDHAFAIYNDLLRNPLHEPPSCRLSDPDKDGLQALLMFDGQHKTVASWMRGKQRIVVKLYLDLSKDAANFLVNSIQAKIKKLPLSPFELQAKMSDEWQSKVEAYESEMEAAGAVATEHGLFQWFPQGTERNRAKSAFKSALAQQFLDHPEFRLAKYVTVKGVDADQTGLTETMVKGKVIDRLVSDRPLESSFIESSDQRAEEVDNIVWMVNQVVDELVEPPAGEELTDNQKETRRRLFKQGSLQYVADLLSQIYRREMLKGDDLLLDGKPDDTTRDKIENGITNLCSHPVWTAGFDANSEMAAVKLALERNQNVKDAFEGVGLDLAYAVVGQESPQFKKVWRS